MSLYKVRVGRSLDVYQDFEIEADRMDEAEKKAIELGQQDNDPSHWEGTNLDDGVDAYDTDLLEIYSKCQICGERVYADEDYYSSPCGTFCGMCMERHAIECEVCSKEFGFDNEFNNEDEE